MARWHLRILMIPHEIKSSDTWNASARAKILLASGSIGALEEADIPSRFKGISVARRGIPMINWHFWNITPAFG
jgi:hypothetical protein